MLSLPRPFFLPPFPPLASTSARLMNSTDPEEIIHFGQQKKKLLGAMRNDCKRIVHSTPIIRSYYTWSYRGKFSVSNVSAHSRFVRSLGTPLALHSPPLFCSTHADGVMIRSHQKELLRQEDVKVNSAELERRGEALGRLKADMDVLYELNRTTREFEKEVQFEEEKKKERLRSLQLLPQSHRSFKRVESSEADYSDIMNEIDVMSERRERATPRTFAAFAALGERT